MVKKKEKWQLEGRTGKGGKGKGKGKKRSIMFACLEEEMDPVEEEIPENEVNMAYRHINLSNVLGGNEWERKNWGKECSSIIDTGFNGGGLCSFSWLIRYEEYLRSFYPKAKLIKN